VLYYSIHGHVETVDEALAPRMRPPWPGPRSPSSAHTQATRAGRVPRACGARTGPTAGLWAKAVPVGKVATSRVRSARV